MDVHRPRRAMSPRMTGTWDVNKRVRKMLEEIVTVHQDRLSNIVSVVPCDYVVHIQDCCASVEGLSPKDATEGAVVLLANLSNNCVHRPPI